MGYTPAPAGWWQSFLRELPARTAKLATVRADGGPHVAPVWIDVDGDGDDAEVVFTTGADTVKGRAIRRDGRVALCVDDERPPFDFVSIEGTATTSTDPGELLTWATRIAARYMGAEQADAFGRRNAVPPEMLVRVRPTRVIAVMRVAD